MNKKHRVFIAINLPKDIKNELNKFKSRFTLSQNENFGEWAKWTAKDNLHITLEFLGNLTDVEIGEVCVTVKEVAERHNFFSINLNKILYGPLRRSSKQTPKMVWAIGEPSVETADLKKDLQKFLLEKIRFRPEDRGLTSHVTPHVTPHVTLARILEWEFRKINLDERPEINEDIDLIFTAESIEVMESEMKRGGPVYTILESHTLKD
ncbi:MAG: RNA 2',3'-cyclic phosphodiesterase [Patescibacteria group bacterium]|mgnify:CR=1 FL=1